MDPKRAISESDLGHERARVAVRRHRNGQRRGPVELALRRAAQPHQDAPRDVEHHRRRQCDEVLEGRRRERGERRVAHGTNGCRSGRPVEQTQLAHHLAATEFGDEPFLAVVDDVHRHPTTHDEVGRVGDVALFEQDLAGFQASPVDAVDHMLHDRLVGAAHQLGDHRRDVRAIDTLARLVGHTVGHLRVAVQPVLEVDPFDLQDLDRTARPERRGPQPAGDHGDLADDVAGLDRADDDVALRCRLGGGHPSGLHEVDLVGRVALLDEHLTVGERD